MSDLIISQNANEMSRRPFRANVSTSSKTPNSEPSPKGREVLNQWLPFPETMFMRGIWQNNLMAILNQFARPPTDLAGGCA
jgi:hypothetical protein